MQLTTAAPVQLAPTVSTVTLLPQRLDLVNNTLQFVIVAPGAPPVNVTAPLSPALLTALQTFLKAQSETAMGVAANSTTIVATPPAPALGAVKLA